MLIAFVTLPLITIYASDRGSDFGDGSARRPFKTLQRVDEELKRRRSAGESGEIEVRLSGTFELSAPIEFGPEASSTSFIPWNPHRRPTISGGIELRDWHAKKVGNRTIWTCAVPAAFRYRQLWVDGRLRVPIAAVRDKRLAGLLPSDQKAAWTEGHTVVRYHPTDIPHLAHPEEAEFVGCHLWAESRMGVQAIDPAAGILRFDRKSTFRLTDGDSPMPYRLENVAEAIGTGGDWYYDRSAGEIGWLRTKGRFAVVSTCPSLARFRGTTKTKVEGINFEFTQWEPPKDNAGDGQAAISVPGAVTFDGCREATMSDCHLAHLGTYGIEITGPSEDCLVERCAVEDAGGGGIKISHGSSRSRIVDCRLEHLGRIFASAIGVWIGNSGHNVVAHNLIRDLYYTAISVGWSWGYGPSDAVGNLIEANDMSDIGQGQLSDMGGIYTLGVSPGTVLRANRIRRVESRTYGGWGIYFDEGSSGILAENNLIEDTKTGSLHQHYGRDNLVRNNVFVNARTAGQLIRTRKEDHRSFTVTHNVVIWKNADLLGSNWDGGFDIDENVYWRTDGRPVTFAGKTFAQWKAAGHDVHSLIADPKAEISERGVTFAPDSPATALGIQPLDLSTVGPRLRHL